VKKIALITGINGQDGSYLTQFLLSKNYEVHGTIRCADTDLWRLVHLNIENALHTHTCDLEKAAAVSDLLTDIKPVEIYHLAAQSSIPFSLSDPRVTLNFNFQSTLNILECVRKSDTPIKLFHASTSEIFDPHTPSPIRADSHIKPNHPYGASKASSHIIVQSYRNSFGIYAVNGILFPHESPLRNRNTFLQLIINQAKQVSTGESNKLVVGEPQNIRDFGDARSYVEAMWYSLQAPTPDDYTICSGAPVSIQEVVDFVIAKYQLDPNCITIDNSLVRQPNIPTIFGDSEETTSKIGWKNNLSVYETIESLIEFNKKS